MFNKRQENTSGLFHFLTKELSIPCIAYNTTFVRIFNALLSDVKLDIYIDDDLFAKDLEYKQFGYYIPILEAETHNLKIFVSGQSNTPIVDTQIQIHQANLETLSLVGDLENINIFSVLGEPTIQPYPDKSVIRYANLSQNNIVINVLRNNIIIESGPLNVNQYNKYSVTTPGTYGFQFVLNDNESGNAQTSTTHILNPTRMYTFYLVGNLDPNSPKSSSYPLELVVSVDIATIIKQCPKDMKRF